MHACIWHQLHSLAPPVRLLRSTPARPAPAAIRAGPLKHDTCVHEIQGPRPDRVPDIPTENGEMTSHLHNGGRASTVDLWMAQVIGPRQLNNTAVYLSHVP